MIKKQAILFLIISLLLFCHFNCEKSTNSILKADENLSLVYGNNGNYLKSLILAGRIFQLDSICKVSGFVLHDAATGQTIDLKGQLKKKGENWIFQEKCEPLQLELNVTILPHNSRLLFHGEVKDLSDKDRAVVVSFHLPVDLVGGRFWHDLRRHVKIKSGQSYRRTLPCRGDAWRW